MESNPSSVDKIFECRDLCEEITQAYYLMESVKDAMSAHWDKDGLIDHLAYLLGEYVEKMEQLLPTLNTALNDAYHLAREESLLVQKTKLDEVWKTDTVG
jgi:hypothetical protein